MEHYYLNGELLLTNCRLTDNLIDKTILVFGGCVYRVLSIDSVSDFTKIVNIEKIDNSIILDTKF